MKKLIKLAIPLSILVMTAACTLGTTPPTQAPSALPDAEPQATVDSIAVMGVDPPLENGLSVTDTQISVTVEYNLTAPAGGVGVWFERFHDADCAQVGMDPNQNSTLSNSELTPVTSGSGQVTVTVPMPPLDTEYVGVGAALWNEGTTSQLANDATYAFCYRVNPASP